MQETGYIKSSPTTLESAQFIYDMLLNVSTDPQNAAEILSIVMVRLWLVSAAEDGNLDEMLSSFVRTIKLNVDNQQSTRQ